MFLHVFLFRWKPQATAADRVQAADQIRHLRDSIPTILEVCVGDNQSPRAAEYTFGGVMRFASQADFKAYEVHPAHQALLGWLLPLIEAVELDIAG